VLVHDSGPLVAHSLRMETAEGPEVQTRVRRAVQEAISRTISVREAAKHAVAVRSTSEEAWMDELLGLTRRVLVLPPSNKDGNHLTEVIASIATTASVGVAVDSPMERLLAVSHPRHECVASPQRMCIAVHSSVLGLQGQSGTSPCCPIDRCSVGNCVGRD
jgi:hypothetical protein